MLLLLRRQEQPLAPPAAAESEGAAPATPAETVRRLRRRGTAARKMGKRRALWSSVAPSSTSSPSRRRLGRGFSPNAQSSWRPQARPRQRLDQSLGGRSPAVARHPPRPLETGPHSRHGHTPTPPAHRRNRRPMARALTPLDRRVLRAVRDHRWHTFAAIADAAGEPPVAVGSTLAELRRVGLVDRYRSLRQLGGGRFASTSGGEGALVTERAHLTEATGPAGSPSGHSNLGRAADAGRSEGHRIRIRRGVRGAGWPATPGRTRSSRSPQPAGGRLPHRSRPRGSRTTP